MNRAELERSLRPDPETQQGSPVTLEHPAKANSPPSILLVVLATLGVLLYAGFLLKPEHRGDLLPYADGHHGGDVDHHPALLSLWTILSAATTRAASPSTRRGLLFDPAGIARRDPGPAAPVAPAPA